MKIEDAQTELPSLGRGELLAKLARTVTHRSILLVEDDPDGRFLLPALLHGSGLLIDIVDGGERAVERVQARRYDLILMDVEMRGLDGLETCRIIRRLPRNSDVPIVAVTGHASSQDRERFLEAGMNDVLVKPFDLQALCSSILDGLWAGRVKAALARTGGRSER